MSAPQSPNQAIRDLLFRRAKTLNQLLLKRLSEAQEYLSTNHELAAIGALAGMESDIATMRKLMTIARDWFQTEKPGGGDQ